MQRAAAAAYASLHRRWPRARRLLVLAGAGNNGGDAFELATLALHDGLEIDLRATSAESTGDAALARAAFAQAGGVVAAIDAPFAPFDVAVDGLFGTGLARPIEGAAAALIERANAAGRPILALDLPSGLDADSGVRLGPTIRAAATIAFVGWKRGLFTADANDACGERELAPLGIPVAARDAIAADAWLMGESLWALLPPRPHNVHKGMFGHVLALGGNDGMGGAIRLAAEAALRSGAGLVSVATRPDHVVALNAARPEIMAHGVDDSSSLGALLATATTLALGPGLGVDAWAQMLYEAALAAGKPCVIDADALNLLARRGERPPASAILTPHPGEAARLLGSDAATVQRDRFGAARRLAAHFGAVVVLKGSGSLVADPAGDVAVCPWGNPGMAAGGFGDVLTGVIAALLAQGLSARDAARLGVAVHARAGDLAAAGEPRGLVAGDLVGALRQVVNEAGGG
jgi:NAD(P)H-hydrate epimerase